MAKGQLFGGTGSRERFAVLSGYPYTPIIRCSQDGREGGRALNLKVVLGYYEGIICQSRRLENVI